MKTQEYFIENSILDEAQHHWNSLPTHERVESELLSRICSSECRNDYLLLDGIRNYKSEHDSLLEKIGTLSCETRGQIAYSKALSGKNMLEHDVSVDEGEEYFERLEGNVNAAQTILQILRFKKVAMTRHRITPYAPVKKTMPVLQTRARARSYRSHRKTSVANSSPGDDGGGSDSDPDSNSSARYNRHLVTFPNFQPNSSSLAVAVFPRQMLHELTAGRWAA